MTKQNKQLLRTLFFLSKSDIQQSGLVVGNMYGFHFATYTCLEHRCVKGPLTLEEELEHIQQILEKGTSKSVIIYPVPGLPSILNQFHKLEKMELASDLLCHINKLDQLCKNHKKMLIVVGYLPVTQGKYLSDSEASQVNESLMYIDGVLKSNNMFKKRLTRYFPAVENLKSPEIRKCGIYPTSTCYRRMGQMVRDYIFRTGFE